MDLVMAPKDDSESPHAWENITLVEEEADLTNKLLPRLHF